MIIPIIQPKIESRFEKKTSFTFTFLAEISVFDADITFFAKRLDPDTRQWFFDDFNAWFSDPGNSRAYVLLGDPGVGKSVIAGALAQRMRETGQLGAAYFCRHNDGTRNDPRYLLGTVAHQLCACNDKYNEILGGEDRVKMLLGNSKLGVKELFTKLLHEPLSTCRPCHQKFLVIIDALDETENESREDFLDLIKHHFPLLPEWLVFFVTSRPEDSVQSRLKKYNPCIKICSGNSDLQNFYQQHEQDIQNFLRKRINYPCVTISVHDVSQKCDGLFLYAHYIVEELKDVLVSGKKISNLNDLFPGDIEEFFLQNFRRVYDHVGENIFQKLFGCVVVAPSPLPVSVISFILDRENSDHDRQQVIDAVSQFLVLRNPDQTLTFLHNLVPAWLTNDTKAPRKLLICMKIAGKYLREVFVEILSSIIQESSSPCTSIDVKLKDYVMRVAVSFLCQFGGKDWLELVFTCLTNYHFIERRLRSGKIEIYHLLQDLKLVRGCLDDDDKKKQDLLQEIAQVLSSNIFVLVECPQLLHSCLRTASSAVQETLLLSKLPVPCLECTVFAKVDPAIADMNCFATSCDKETVVGAKGRSLLFFDGHRAHLADGPFEISDKIIHNITHLEYSRDSKFIFFGRLDKWFSVKRKCVENFFQFNWNATVYQWGFLTRDGESIVVKRNMEDFSCPWSENTCLSNLLALWAVKEIEESRDDVTDLSEELEVEGPIKCLLKCLSYKANLARPHVNAISPPNRCRFCCELHPLTVQGYHEASLTAVREKIINIYPWIFQRQMLDLKTGRPVLERVFSRDIQLDPFTYICHMSYFVNGGGMEKTFSDFSVCNIAIMTAIRYLEGGLGLKLEWEPPVELKPAKMSDLKAERTVKLEELLEDLLKRDMALGLIEELKQRVNLKLECVLRRIKECETVTKEHEIESPTQEKTKRGLENGGRMEEELKSMRFERTSELVLKHKLESELDFLLSWKWELNLEVAFIQECMAQLKGKLSSEVEHLESKLRVEVDFLRKREYVLEHNSTRRNRGLEIDRQELTVERVRELQNKLACLKELKQIPERHRGQELDQGESNLKQKLDFLLERARELRHEIDVLEFRDCQVLKLILELEHRWKREHLNASLLQIKAVIMETWPLFFEPKLTSTEYEWVKHRSHELKQLEVNVTAEEELESLLIEEQKLINVGVFPEKREEEKRLETLIERRGELMHKMEMELSRKRDHEVKGAQCWTTWIEKELMLKSRENLLMKEDRWFRLHLLTRNLKKQLEQGLEHWLDRELGVWGSYLRVLKKDKMEMHPYLVKEFQYGSIKFEDYTNFPEGLHDDESIVNGDILIYLSPGGKWVLEADGLRNKNVLRKRNRELSCDHETLQRDIGKFTRFSFTKDDLYLVYLTDNGSLHALFLETGTILTSVSSNQIIYFTEQDVCGYLFCSDTKETAILFSDLSSPFKFISASPLELPVVEKTIAAVFCSTNTVLSVSSDLKVSFWQTAEPKDGFSFISQSLHDTSGLQVKNCALSPNGQLVAIHQGSELMLYTFTDFSLVETRTVFTEEFGYTISSLSFSGDSASLLYCFRVWQSFTRGDVWDVVGKLVSSSLKSQALVVECCCISSGKQEIMLCGKYQIEIWEYSERSCHLLTTLHIEKMDHSVWFSQCIVSSDDQLLVCCIANTILVYRRNALDINSSKRVLLGHLGKIEFCRFLKENRYLISYGIDGMVFLWDIIEFKAVGFARIPLDTVCMAVSPDEEKAVCYSTDLICVVKLCELKSPSH